MDSSSHSAGAYNLSEKCSYGDRLCMMTFHRRLVVVYWLVGKGGYRNAPVNFE